MTVQNPTPLPHLQVGPRFRLYPSLEQAAETSVTPVPQTDDDCPFCLSYYLKGVCNSNCGGRHAHRTLSSHDQGVLSAWKSRFCTAQPPVTKITAPHWAPGGGSVVNTTLYTRSRRSQGTRSTRSRDTKTWHTTPPPKMYVTPDPKIEVINLQGGRQISKRPSMPYRGVAPQQAHKISSPSTSIKKVAGIAMRGITKYKITKTLPKNLPPQNPTSPPI